MKTLLAVLCCYCLLLACGPAFTVGVDAGQSTEGDAQVAMPSADPPTANDPSTTTMVDSGPTVVETSAPTPPPSMLATSDGGSGDHVPEASTTTSDPPTTTTVADSGGTQADPPDGYTGSSVLGPYNGSCADNVCPSYYTCSPFGGVALYYCNPP